MYNGRHVGHHLHALIVKGDLSLDVTVKGVGGTQLSHHSANLARELSYGLGKNIRRRNAYIDDVRAEEIDRPLYFAMGNGRTLSSLGATGYDDDYMLVIALKEKQLTLLLFSSIQRVIQM